jgi:hypothetical protein
VGGACIGLLIDKFSNALSFVQVPPPPADGARERGTMDTLLPDPGGTFVVVARPMLSLA